jgi:methylglutaconyl-CoA hydratase
MSELLREEHGAIVRLVLNRPDRRNALSRSLLAALSDTLDQVAANPMIRVVVLAASGPAFCAGMDLKEASALGSGVEAEAQAVQDAQALAHLLDQIHGLGKPTIAAVQGDALAGGAGLALACDFVVMAAEARLGYPEVRRGLVPAIVLEDLARQIAGRRARELVLLGEPIAAETAERWGLVNRVVPAPACGKAAMELAAALLASAPGAVATTKRLLDEATGRPADRRGAASVSASARVGDEAAEGIRAFLEKRPPRWSMADPNS